jgi:hypothetical protein
MDVIALFFGPIFGYEQMTTAARNVALRDQFNVARVSIGMTEAEVESAFGAKPLESGKVDEGDYKLYGVFGEYNNDLPFWLHFSNVLIVFRDGKANTILGIPAHNLHWHRELEEGFVDLPKSGRLLDKIPSFI